MKKITQFAVDYPVSILMIIFAIGVLGWFSFDKLGVDLFPNLNNPRLFIEVRSGERPPEEMEKKFVESLESMAIRQIGVVEVASVVRAGSAQITVEFGWKTDMDEAFLDLQKAVNTFSNKEQSDEIRITQHDPNAAPIMVIGFSKAGDPDLNQLRKLADHYIRNELVRIEGVAEVEVSGAEESEMRITTDSYRLQAFGLTLSEISQKIMAHNQQISGGTITESGMQYIVKGVSLLKTVEDFNALVVGYKSTQKGNPAGTRAPIYLQEVASISVSNQDPINIVRLNGQRCLALSVYKETKFNTVKAVAEVNKSLTAIRKILPSCRLDVITNQGTFISQAIGEVKDSLLVGIVLAIGVLYFFLRRAGTTLIVSITIPISIVATFLLMYFTGMSLNIMTLGGLALGAGMLVDNAIVVIENIFRNHEEGKSVRDAAIIGTSEVGIAITASTITTIVVFLPIVYLHGASGELFRDQALTVTYSLLCSLFAAILVLPMLYKFFYANKPAPVSTKSLKFAGYGRFLEKVLKKRVVVMVTAIIVTIGSFLLVPFIGTEFMPQADSREFTFDLKMQEGTTLPRTSAAVSNIEQVITDALGNDLELIYSQVGPSGGLSDNASSVYTGENTANVRIILKKESKRSPEDVMAIITKATSGVLGLEIGFNRDDSALRQILGTQEAPVVVEIKGDDLNLLTEICDSVKARMLLVKDIYNIQTSIEEGTPEVEIQLNRIKAGMYNLSMQAVIDQVKSQLEGQDAGQVDYQGELRPIKIRIPEKSLSQLDGLLIQNGDQVFRLSEIATISRSRSPREIYHRNQVRMVKIFAQKASDVPLDKVAKQIEERISSIQLPSQYRIQVTGEEEKRKEAMANLSTAFILSILLVYMVMASQFESLVHPFTIMLSIPLSLAGTFITFFILGRPMNIMALIGIIMLAGITVNASIILIDRITQLRKSGLNRHEAIVVAARQRIRPILMTTLTTILALIPMVIGFGEGASLRAPMALAVIGGLVSSTILTLIVIPCFYDTFDRLLGRFQNDQPNND
ncbi:efflux RND transporter permease subunit [Williamwhitmania taraxaci]|uniref:Hydrophobic/amphiphilic exporter-1, HAE1 family n=1 Tax=Williamwhitmania taraxaci TaxID=1640674 RepID=A0A1G6NHU1_9BACT|nr:efflux RND transporter permease subunit [Williamwhitmania taraxaci]SDC67409.1 hydrophobic/amphiphilic exporter-1, HAE1 family [Williamwhitmania taraxaci]